MLTLVSRQLQGFSLKRFGGGIGSSYAELLEVE